MEIAAGVPVGERLGEEDAGEGMDSTWVNTAALGGCSAAPDDFRDVGVLFLCPFDAKGSAVFGFEIPGKFSLAGQTN